jgi:hypothetical protein
MSIKSKLFAGTAALSLTAGGLGAIGAAAANAATPSCGSDCTTFYTEGWGSGSVLDVYKQAEKAGQKIILWSAGNSDRAEDFTISDEGTVKQFYKAGLASAALELHYKKDKAIEVEYTPDGVDTGLCVGVGSTAGNGTGVKLEDCGVSSKTLWVEDDVLGSDSSYTALINGSDTNFSHPYVLTNSGGALITYGIGQDDGVYYDNQLWAQENGVL